MARGHTHTHPLPSPLLTRIPPVQVAYCLAAVVRNCAAPLLEAMGQMLMPGAQQQQGGAGPALGLRKGLWELLVVWTEEAFILLPDIKVCVGGGRKAVDVHEAAVGVPHATCHST